MPDLNFHPSVPMHPESGWHQMAVEQSMDAILLTNPDGGVLAANPAACALFGYSEEELRAQGRAAVFDIMDPGNAAALVERERTGRFAGALTYRRKDGSTFPGEVTTAVFRTAAGEVRTSMIIRDVTARVRAGDRQQLLAEAVRLYRQSVDFPATLQEVCSLAVPSFADWCMVDLLRDDGSIGRVAVAATSPEREDQLWRIGRDFPPLLGDPHPVATAIRTGATELHRDISGEYWHSIAQDEQHLSLLLQISTRCRLTVPLVARGRTLGAISFCSAHRNYDAEEATLAEQLADRGALAIDNARLFQAEQEARTVAETALAIRDRFLSAITHDLGQPLTVIRTATHLVQRELANVTLPDEATSPMLVAHIRGAADRLSSMVGELVDLARLQAGRELDLVTQPANLVALVHAEVFAAQQTTDRHTIKIEVADPTLVLELDAPRIARVLANLLSNAVKYSPDGGTIVVSLGMEAVGGKRWAVCTVQDEGIGIPPQDIAHVLEPFRRGSNVAGRIRGTGIGLSSARMIAVQHGGTLTVASTEGKGTSVTLRLPCP